MKLTRKEIKNFISDILNEEKKEGVVVKDSPETWVKYFKNKADFHGKHKAFVESLSSFKSAIKTLDKIKLKKNFEGPLLIAKRIHDDMSAYKNRNFLDQRVVKERVDKIDLLVKSINKVGAAESVNDRRRKKVRENVKTALKELLEASERLQFTFKARFPPPRPTPPKQKKEEPKAPAPPKEVAKDKQIEPIYVTFMKDVATKGGVYSVKSKSRGPRVKIIQNVITIVSKDLGIQDKPEIKAFAAQKNPADGIYGPKTAEAIKAIQRALKIDVDGIVGKQTMAAILQQKTPVDPNGEKITPGNLTKNLKNFEDAGYVYGGPGAKSSAEDVKKIQDRAASKAKSVQESIDLERWRKLSGL